MRLFRLLLLVLTLLLAVNMVVAQDNPNPFTPPGAVPLGDIGLDETIKIPFPFDARFYLKLTSQSEGFISVQFEADNEIITPPSVYMLNSDAEVLNGYSSSTQGERVTALFGVYGKPPYYIIFNRPVALSVTVFEGDRVRHRREDIEPEEHVEGQYEPSGEAVYHQLEGVQANDIVTFDLYNDSQNLQLFNGSGQFINRSLAYCRFENHAIQSYRLIGDPPYTVQLSHQPEYDSPESYTLTMRMGRYVHEPIKNVLVDTPIELSANSEGICESIIFKPPHSGEYVLLSEGNINPRSFTQMTTDSRDNNVIPIDYLRDDRHVISHYRFDSTDPVKILVGNDQSIRFSITENTQLVENLFEFAHVKSGDGPVAIIQSDSGKTRRYEVNGEKGDRVFIMTLYDPDRPYCYPIIYDRNFYPLYSYDYRFNALTATTSYYWTEYILGSSKNYNLFSMTNECSHIFQVFKAGTFVTYDDLEKSFAPLIPWRPPYFNS